MKKVATSAVVHASNTPIGYWRFAANYWIAARMVEKKLGEEPHLYFPMFQLYGMAIELALKAFLLKRGTPSAEVRKFRHDLAALLVEARRRKLGSVAVLDRREASAIDLLNLNYGTTKLRYIVPGPTQLPQPIYIHRAAEELITQLEPYCTGMQGRLKKYLE